MSEKFIKDKVKELIQLARAQQTVTTTADRLTLRTSVKLVAMDIWQNGYDTGRKEGGKAQTIADYPSGQKEI